MTNRELSEKLCHLGCLLDDLSEGNQSNSEYQRQLVLVAAELHELSNENFTPGNSWTDLRKQTGQGRKKQRYVNSAGKLLPF